MAQLVRLNGAIGSGLAARRCQQVRLVGARAPAQRSVLARAEQEPKTTTQAEQVRLGECQMRDSPTEALLLCTESPRALQRPHR